MIVSEMDFRERGSRGRSPSREGNRMEHPWRDALCRVLCCGHDGAWPSRGELIGGHRYGSGTRLAGTLALKGTLINSLPHLTPNT
jgi:hypothetical protein